MLRGRLVPGLVVVQFGAYSDSIQLPGHAPGFGQLGHCRMRGWIAHACTSIVGLTAIVMSGVESLLANTWSSVVQSPFMYVTLCR